MSDPAVQWLSGDPRAGDAVEIVTLNALRVL
jgi:hypothetical protein